MATGIPSGPLKRANDEPWRREHKLAMVALILTLIVTFLVGVFPAELRHAFGFDVPRKLPHLDSAPAQAPKSNQEPSATTPNNPSTVTLTNPEPTGATATQVVAAEPPPQMSAWDRLFR